MTSDLDLNNEFYDGLMLNFIEKNAGSALDTAQEYIDDFQMQRIEMVSSFQGSLLAQGNLNKKQILRYFKLCASLGTFIKYESKKTFEKLALSNYDILNMTTKERQKMKIEVIELPKIVSLNSSFRDEFTKHN